jgi:uncharacterized protein YydD (DUF2326 family)
MPGCEASDDIVNMLSCLWDKIHGQKGFGEISDLAKRISDSLGDVESLRVIRDRDEITSKLALANSLDHIYEDVENLQEEIETLKNNMKNVVSYIPWLPASP